MTEGRRVWASLDVGVRLRNDCPNIIAASEWAAGALGQIAPQPDGGPNAGAYRVPGENKVLWTCGISDAFANRNETKHLPYGEGTLRAEPLRDALARFDRAATVISESPDAASTRLIGDVLLGRT